MKWVIQVPDFQIPEECSNRLERTRPNIYHKVTYMHMYKDKYFEGIKDN